MIPSAYKSVTSLLLTLFLFAFMLTIPLMDQYTSPSAGTPGLYAKCFVGSFCD